jgi:membrane associated rhomboid family serine protease
VLASQGIEHVLDHADETGWGLLVAGADHAAALNAIQQYRLESRRWPWQRTIPQTGAVFDWVASAWVLLTGVCYWLSQQRAAMEDAGIMNGTALAAGQWWRLFTATLLHAGLPHLAGNGVFGFILLGLALGRYGTGVGLLAALLAGAGGNLVSWLAHGNAFQGLGASGVVMGALGLITVQSLDQSGKSSQALRILFGGLAAGVMLFVLLGLSPGTDVVAHFGGFLTGIAFGLVLAAGSRVVRGSFANLAAGLIFATLIIGTWWLALRHAG